MNSFKSGFVALIGRPNVGKSTFLNGVLKQKISIISPKPQTTRNCIQGIYTTDSEQIIFIDTPGIHKPLHKLGNFMNDESLSTFDNVDIKLNNSSFETTIDNSFIFSISSLLYKANVPFAL